MNTTTEFTVNLPCRVTTKTLTITESRTIAQTEMVRIANQYRNTPAYKGQRVEIRCGSRVVAYTVIGA